jgi:DNA-binding CsgD family transcriptional regulator
MATSSASHEVRNVLVGRATECAALAALLERARAGESGVLVVRGEPGIGKTALLEAAIEQARELEMGLLRARGVESEAELAFAGLAELLGPVIELRTQIPELQAAGVASALGVGEPMAYARFPVMAGTLSLLAAAADRGPLLAVVDDAQWLDAPSAEALMFVARRLRFEGIALLVALRTEDGNGFVTGGLETLDLAGLDFSASRELVGERRGMAVSDVVARELRDATGGNPLALQTAAELLDGEQLRGGRPLPRPVPVGAQIADAFLARVARLPEATVLALTAAAAGGATDMAQLDAALGVLDLELSDLQPAEDAGLIDLGGSVLEFQHPLLRSALYQAATPGRRREIHAALAASLDADDERCAWHLAAAATGPDEHLAATVELAARGASKRGGHMTAARLLERAADLSPDHDERARRLLRAASDAHRGGRPAWAIQRAERALELVREPRLRAELVHMRGSLEQYAGSTSRARELLVGEAEAIRAMDPRIATLILLDAAATSVLAGDLLAAHATAEAAAEIAVGVEGIVGQLPAALERMLTMTRGEAPPPERLGTLLEDLLSTRALPPGAMWLTQFAVSDLVFSELYATARGGLERMIGALRALSAFGLLPLPLLTQAELDFRTGRWNTAYGAALEAIEIANEADELSLASMALAGAARIEAATGRRESCLTHAIEAERIARPIGARSSSMIASSALGLSALGEGRSEDAIGHLMPIAEQVADSGIGHPAVIQWAPDLVEAYIRAGNTPAAERELAVLQTRARRSKHTWALAASARCRGLLDPPESFEESFAEAQHWHAQTVTPFEAARTHLCHGERLRREGRRADAREPLEAALAIFTQLSAEPWRRRARDELGATTPALRADGDPAAVQRLTSQELRVANVIAGGATNREAAAALFLSPKTVNAHLESIYRKLAIKRRSQLARIFAQPTEPAAQEDAREET